MSSKVETERKHKASFWCYTGNHPNGKDCPRDNSHGYPLEVIRSLYYGDRNNCTVKRGKGTLGTGYDVAVYALESVWDEAMIQTAKLQGETIQCDYAGVEVIERDGSQYLVGEGREICEVCYVLPGTDLVELIKNGRGLITVDEETYDFSSEAMTV